jgi:hypothetical protein
MKPLFLCLVLLLWPQFGITQSGPVPSNSNPDGEDPYAEQTIRMAISLPGISVSSIEKLLNRLGDRAAIGIMRVMADQPLTRPDQIKTLLSILRDAFRVPGIVTVDADRQPKATLFLLRSLQNLPISRDLKTEIDQTKAFVSRDLK